MKSLLGWTSPSDILDLDPIRCRVTETELTGEVDVRRKATDRRQACAGTPLLQAFQCDRIQGHRVFARVQRGMMQRVVRLRLWAARILRDEAIHQIKDDL